MIAISIRKEPYLNGVQTTTTTTTTTRSPLNESFG